jgi:hypothetical protein
LIFLLVEVTRFLVFNHSARHHSLQLYTEMTPPGSQAVYAKYFDRQCFLSGYRTIIFDTYCEWVGIRYYAFDTTEAATAYQKIAAMLTQHGLRQEPYAQNEYRAQFSGGASVSAFPACSDSKYETPRQVTTGIDIGSAKTNEARNRFLQNMQQHYPDKVFCGYVLISGKYIFH